MKGNDKCHGCGNTFGEKGKDGLIHHRAYGSDSSTCTACALWESREASRREDDNQNWSINHGRRSGGPHGIF